MSITAIQSIPLDIRKELSDFHIPWEIDNRIFNEMKSQETSSYKKVQVLPADPEWRFVWRYFHQDKPKRYNIKKIYCIYERRQQQAFEFNLSSIEREASTFQPTWYQEPRAKQRAKAIERWQQSANIFSPFSNIRANGKRTVWKNTKIFPLWHGSSEKMCESIAKSGFANFGKILPGGSTYGSIDEGFFGRGIYFTNSARYASDIYSKGHIFLAWVSMKEPFPIVGDPCQLDMKAIKGKGAYKDYNAHYIPVTSINPSNPYETIYYPTKEDETPHCDEFVVFHKYQTLPRFWVELEVELTYAPSDSPKCVNELVPHFMKLLQNPSVDKDSKLRNFLCRELGSLLIFEGDDYLEERHETMYEQLKHILDSQGKVNKQVSRALMETPQSFLNTPISQSSVFEVSTVQAPMTYQPITSDLEFNSILSQLEQIHIKKVRKEEEINIKKHREKDDGFHKLDSIFSKPTVISNTKDSYSSIPSIAFGKADWEKYFGDIGVEPPLPADIENILNEPCSFWPDKKVKETHLLVLIPNKVNRKPFTMKYLGRLIKKPKFGHSTKYEFYYAGAKEEACPSHWVLMTRDIIPSSRGYLGFFDLIANYRRRTGLPYEVPHLLEATTSILMHYVRTGERLYSDDPLTWTYSQDVDKNNDSLVVGAFALGGLNVSSHYSVNNGVAGCWKF